MVVIFRRDALAGADDAEIFAGEGIAGVKVLADGTTAAEGEGGLLGLGRSVLDCTECLRGAPRFLDQRFHLFRLQGKRGVDPTLRAAEGDLLSATRKVRSVVSILGPLMALRPADQPHTTYFRY